MLVVNVLRRSSTNSGTLPGISITSITKVTLVVLEGSADVIVTDVIVVIGVYWIDPITTPAELVNFPGFSHFE